MAYSLEGVKWASTTVTWSFSGDDGGGAQASSSVQAAFSEWAQASGLHFVQVADAASPSIRISYSNMSPGTTNEMGYASYSYSGNGNLTSVNVQMESPAILPLVNGIYSGYTSSFHQVALHEIGHAIGMAHDSSPTSVMYETATASNRTLSRLDVEGVRANYQDLWTNEDPVQAANPGPSVATMFMTDGTTGISTTPTAQAYNGPVGYLSSMMVSGDGPVAIVSPGSFTFIVTGKGDDAVQVTSGDNVISAGAGSNFLTGGTGKDTFFVDGRDPGTTWDTITNFHRGDMVTLWGYKPGVSTTWWDSSPSGAQDYTGATMRISMNGDGAVNASVTFADMGVARAQAMEITTGVQGAGTYMMVRNT